MPSPFPGMDPYMEDPQVWPGVHDALLTVLSFALNAIVPKRYVARLGERIYVVQPKRSIYGDIVVARKKRSPQGRRPAKGAGTLTCDPPWEFTVTTEERREIFIEIVLPREGRRVVTVIEALSPANKTTGDDGRELYLEKQHELLHSKANLVEIDLLRQGDHTVAVPLIQLADRGAWDYLVCRHRGGQAEKFQVWATTVRKRLPRIAIPLSKGDSDVMVDLQACFDRCYDEGAFEREFDYRREPVVPLSKADAAWADALLRESGFRIVGRR